ncbi:5-carboxymethyl-2-hydroxymuconate Delta-isomerase [Photobacterium sp. TY1-4]|uniref:5-carboxymethyl-2-hydroxymuconate Delta-isomerase n=1 Tax=Photobacterium sp. TY1-4 TaxID=2899122 RepID=UPI0021BE8564|nr:5-carboxymethyl-2-hydroxymuconate Delta-isomerase [Photobacterium sp. TY1-4]UXI03865.1 5-carboxymethyl-2-hydroxymuconate Delta-isomerase [Photobacterium sp. TY1-4]
MPHCIIEYSKGLEAAISPDELSSTVFEGALASGLFTPADIKTRVIPYTSYQVGETTAGFIHVTARILAGRNETKKKNLSHQILERLQQLDQPNTSYTVEVVDIDVASYAKSAS